jgi:hypothetical protein
MEDKNMEECIEQEDDIMFDGNAVEENGLRGHIKGVGHQRRLNHDKRVIDILFIEDMPAGEDQ